MLRKFDPPLPPESKYNEFRAEWLYSIVYGSMGRALAPDDYRYFSQEFKALPSDLKDHAHKLYNGGKTS